MSNGWVLIFFELISVGLLFGRIRGTLRPTRGEISRAGGKVYHSRVKLALLGGRNNPTG